MWEAALGLLVLRMSDQRELPVLGSTREIRVEPSGIAVSAPVQFCFVVIGAEAAGEEFSPPGTKRT